MLGTLILGIFLISVFWKYKKLAVAGFCLLVLTGGIWQHQLAKSKIVHPQEENLSFVATVVKDPDVRVNSAKLTVASEDVVGKILLTVNLYPQYQYGDRLKIKGDLMVPQVFDDFNYKDYLAKEGIYAVMYWPKVEFLENKPSPAQKILQLKDKLRESIFQNLSPPQSSLLASMILGDKRKLSDDLKEKLNIAGLRHITAISGMHVAILMGVIMSTLTAFGRRPAFYATLIIIALFIFMTGLQPSAVRAGIMGSMFLLANYLGRQGVSSRGLVFAAAFMLLLNPLLLRQDVGFQLSFLAVIGIIYLMPVFQNLFQKLPVSSLRDIISMTLAAQIFTLPILVYNFGQMSSVSVPANILVVPLLPFIMISGFLFALLGIISQTLGWILSWPSWLLLTWVSRVAEWLSQIPFAYLTLEISWVWLVVAYLLLGFIVWQLNRRIPN